MPTPPSPEPTIHLCEANPRTRGDLFARLMTDLLVALGYGAFRLNIQKAGREVDIQGTHRTEPRAVVAECKAESRPIGGDQVNKFVGVLDAERRKRPDIDVHGYFISLSGFTETAIEQELDAGGRRITLLSAAEIIRELVAGHIVVPLSEATERAGRIAGQRTDALKLTPPATLLATDCGWIWSLNYRDGSAAAKSVLIHADGEPVPESVFQQLRVSACQGNCFIRRGDVLIDQDATSAVGRDQVRRRYFEYLQQECGEIQLQGLPADQEVGARRLALEALFVPLHVVPLEGSKSRRDERLAVGSALEHDSRLAILANPGAGKTTLLKRLAVAYAFPERRLRSEDKLPDKRWYPLFIRCRQILNPLAPIEAILRDLPSRGEFSEFGIAFADVVRESLQLGTALLLIDGLDEIADEGHRLSFVEQLRTFLARYPAAAVVVTSREAGFRIVGGRLADQCKHYRLAELDDDDIHRLTIAWHLEVVGNRDDVRREAITLANAICRLDRVRYLAGNPLLLTTLLLVKRWVGQLPTKRVVLYNKAIEVLLMTWNVEAHRPLDPEEIVPQLAFVAHWMMEHGVQQISQRQLYKLLILARQQMPEVLGFARLSGAEVVKNVEFRSSLLVQAGHTVEDGELVAVYEFRHLTFQEYLTARALVDGYYVDRQDSDSLLEKLKPHFEDETWAEVIPLTAVVAGRRCEPVIKALLEIVAKDEGAPFGPKPAAADILARCLSDEVQVSPETLDHAFLAVVRSAQVGVELSELLDSRYGARFRELILEAHARSTDALLSVGNAVAEVLLRDAGVRPRGDLNAVVIKQASTLLRSNEPVDIAKGCLLVMEIAYLIATHDASRRSSSVPNALRSTRELIAANIASADLRVRFAAAWATAWLGEAGLLTERFTLQCARELLGAVTTGHNRELTYVCAWAFANLPLVDHGRFRTAVPWTESLQIFIESERAAKPHRARNDQRVLVKTLITLSIYYGKPWSQAEAAERTLAAVENDFERGRSWARARLLQLGAAGAEQLERLPSS